MMDKEKAMLAAFVLLIAVLPLAAAAEEQDDQQRMIDEIRASLPSGQALGIVRANVVEWKPDLTGLGAGLFTFTEFDFGGFFEEIGKALYGFASAISANV